MQTHRSTALIILAAGRSSRMGEGHYKLLLPLGDRPVLAHVLAAAQASHARPIVLVIGHQAEQVRTQATPYITRPDLTIVENSAYLQGMSTSLHVGIQALINHDNTTPQVGHAIDSVIVLAGDQPLLTSSIIDTLITTRETSGKSIVVSHYNGKRGNPTLFAANLFPELLNIQGDQGGRSILNAHRQDIAIAEHGDPTASYDVDTWNAYQQVLTLWQHRTGTHEQ
jgi:molybdenum cofactor cytidylyltransferase